MPTESEQLTDHLIQIRSQASIDVEARGSNSSKRPTFQIRAYNGGPLRLTGFYLPIVIDLAGLRTLQNTPILLGHDHSMIVGQSNRVEVTKNRVELSGTLTGENEATREVVSQAKNGFKWQASVGVGIERIESIQEDVTAKVNGQKFTGPIYVARLSRLAEVSFLAVGADENSEGLIAAEYQPRRKRVMPKLFKRKESDRTDAIDPESHPSEPQHDSARGERERIAEIRELCAGFPTVEEKAIEENWSVGETAQYMCGALRKKDQLDEYYSNLPKVRESRSSSPVDGMKGGDLVAAAYLIHAGYESIAVEHLGERTAQAGRDMQCHSMLDITKLALRCDHVDTPRDRNDLITASFSTMSLPVGLSNAANKVALMAYKERATAWTKICKRSAARDFKEQRHIRVVTQGDFQKVGGDGQLKHLSLGEDTYGSQIETVGAILGINRVHIINDDLGLLNGAEILGRQAARAVADEFALTLLSNTDFDGNDFFHTDNGNLLSGADSVLSIAGLDAALVLMRSQKDSANRDLDLRPRLLFVPPILETAARELLNSQSMARYVSEEADKLPEGNPFSGRLELEVDARLSNSDKYPNASDTAFYVFSQMSDGAVIVSFLDGRENPTIQQVDAGPEKLGINFRGFLDFGVALGDSVGAVKSTGTA